MIKDRVRLERLASDPAPAGRNGSTMTTASVNAVSLGSIYHYSQYLHSINIPWQWDSPCINIGGVAS
jgi:hypothetical protein